ncbi:hypothetical protein MKX03_008952 [Papaver bracteatum]|nr:hypothetical protein MKX03_008952 [Papaver bracteatum]
MAAEFQLRFSPQSNPHDLAGNSQFSTRTSSRLPSLPLSSPSNISFNSRSPANLSLSLLQSKSSKPKLSVNAELSADTGGNSGSGIGNHNTGGDGNNGGGGDSELSADTGGNSGSGIGNHNTGGDGNNGGGGDSGRRNNDGDGNSDNQSSASSFGILGLLLNGWRSRVAADPQFPFNVLMEEIVGVSACVLGDMASRPNFGLNELDFVFSTLVVGSILNFVLMYMLAPTMGSASSSLPAMFASCPQSHMFEPGMFTLLDRFGTFVYKGAVFAADWVCCWTSKGLPPVVFKGSVVVLRCMNNVLGGVSFVTLARLTGSQKVEGKPVVSIKKGVEEETGTAEKKG